MCKNRALNSSAPASLVSNVRRLFSFALKMTSHLIVTVSEAVILTFISTCNPHPVQPQRTDDGRKLLFAHATGSTLLELGTNITSTIPGTPPTHGVTFDVRSGLLYWTVLGSAGGIYRAHEDSSGVTQVMSTEAIGKP